MDLNFINGLVSKYSITSTFLPSLFIQILRSGGNIFGLIKYISSNKKNTIIIVKIGNWKLFITLNKIFSNFMFDRMLETVAIAPPLSAKLPENVQLVKVNVLL